MNLNTILAIIIVLIFILFFWVWVVSSGILLFSGHGSEFLSVFIPGAIVFGFWSLVTYRLYYCPPPQQ